MDETEDIRSLKLTLGVYLLIFAMKLVVYWLSGVMALFAEALHSAGRFVEPAWRSRDGRS